MSKTEFKTFHEEGTLNVKKSENVILSYLKKMQYTSSEKGGSVLI